MSWQGFGADGIYDAVFNPIWFADSNSEVKDPQQR
jgi:hypothetical protein